MNIDLTGNITYTLDEINRRLAAEIRSQVTVDDELKASRLGRKSTASRTTIEKAHMVRVDTHIDTVLGSKSKVVLDNTLLQDTLSHEAAEARLAEVVLDPAATHEEAGDLLYPMVDVTETMADGTVIVTGQVEDPAIVADITERNAAQAVLDDVASTKTNISNAKVRLAKAALDPNARAVLVVPTYPKIAKLDKNMKPTKVMLTNVTIQQDLDDRASAKKSIAASKADVLALVKTRKAARDALTVNTPAAPAV